MEEKRTIGYICPECGAAVIGERTVFALSAGPAAVVCDCGKSEWISETDGSSFRLTVPCGLCGGEHLAVLFVTDETSRETMVKLGGVLSRNGSRVLCLTSRAPHGGELPKAAGAPPGGAPRGSRS